MIRLKINRAPSFSGKGQRRLRDRIENGIEAVNNEDLNFPFKKSS